MLKEALAVISVIGFIVVSVLAFVGAKYGAEWATKMMDTILPMIVQAWILNFSVIIQYKFGSSASSEEKSKSINRIVEKNLIKDECIDPTSEAK